ncbi:hypothetical protein [Clostridium beijerinckii]|uniref:hypothetical protein n=1 Tax=Clostridium beijerinckii TaxID=1520 RepID=UPI00047CB97D|nr:hypothetical protein [Clostridium beijerinckii]
MDKIKTFVIREGEMVQGNDPSIKLDDNYIELINKNDSARYLKINLDFRNFRKSGAVWNPVVLINGEPCPMPIQKDFEITPEANFDIQSLQINDEFFCGDITMILIPNYIKDK